MSRAILILDMSYTCEMFFSLKIDAALKARSLGGYFNHVISVHPLAGRIETKKCGDPSFWDYRTFEVEQGHLFVEGGIQSKPWLRFLPPLNFILSQIQLIRFLLRVARCKKIDFVRVGDPYYLGLMGYLISRILGIPLVIRVPFRYDNIFEETGGAVFPKLFRYRWLEKRIERFVFPRCSLVAGANQDNATYAIENGALRDRTIVFRYGNLIHPSHWVEPTDRHLDRQMCLQWVAKGVPVLMTVARLEKMKKVRDVIEVLRILRSKGFEAHSVIIGSGSEVGALKDLIVKYRLESCVSLVGELHQEKIASILPLANVVVSPHMGRALTEACLAAVPIVAYDYDWQREVIIDGETGILVPSGDYEHMAKAVCKLLSDISLASRLGRNARKLVFEMMHPDKLSQYEIQQYERLFDARQK